MFEQEASRPLKQKSQSDNFGRIGRTSSSLSHQQVSPSTHVHILMLTGSLTSESIVNQMFTCCGQGPLSFGRGLVRRRVGRYSVRVFRPLAWSRIYACIFYTPSCAMFVRSVSAFHRPRSIRALVAFLLVSFDQGLSALLYLVFSPPVTLPSHFSRVFAGGHLPALGYTGAIQVTTFVPAPMCVSSMPFIPLGPDPNHIPVAEVNRTSSSPELACREAITVYHIVHSLYSILCQKVLSERLTF